MEPFSFQLPAPAGADVPSTCRCWRLQQVLEAPATAGAVGSSTCRCWWLQHLQVLEAPTHAGAGDVGTCRCWKLKAEWLHHMMTCLIHKQLGPYNRANAKAPERSERVHSGMEILLSVASNRAFGGYRTFCQRCVRPRGVPVPNIPAAYSLDACPLKR